MLLNHMRNLNADELHNVLETLAEGGEDAVKGMGDAGEGILSKVKETLTRPVYKALTYAGIALVIITLIAIIIKCKVYRICLRTTGASPQVRNARATTELEQLEMQEMGDRLIQETTQIGPPHQLRSFQPTELTPVEVRTVKRKRSNPLYEVSLRPEIRPLLTVGTRDISPVTGRSLPEAPRTTSMSTSARGHLYDTVRFSEDDQGKNEGTHDQPKQRKRADATSTHKRKKTIGGLDQDTIRKTHKPTHQEIIPRTETNKKRSRHHNTDRDKKSHEEENITHTNGKHEPPPEEDL